MSRRYSLVWSVVRHLGARSNVGAVLVGRPWLLTLLLLLPITVSAQTPDSSRVPADVRAAHEFLMAAYPDLLRQPLAVQLKPEGGVWLVSVAEAPSPRKPDEPVATQPPTAVLLRATIAFDGAGKLAGYEAAGPYLHDGANAVLRDRVRNHPQWIQSDADVELMRLGGEATVGRAFVPAAHPEAGAVKRHLGDGVRAGAAQFALRAQAPDGVTTIVRAVWLLEATAMDAGGAALLYQFTYEPVGGRLVGVTKVGGAQ